MKGTVLLTDALAATVMPGERKELTLRDARTPGLMLRVRDSGAREQPARTSWRVDSPVEERSRLVPLAGLEPARCFHHLILSESFNRFIPTHTFALRAWFNN